MQFFRAQRQPNAQRLNQSAIAAVLACALAGFSAVPAVAESRTFAFENTDSDANFVSFYRKWSGGKKTDQVKVNIQPAGAKTKQAVKTSQSAAKKTKKANSDDITDADILAQSDSEANDPFEPVNRLVFGLNEVLDQAILTPVSKTYRFIVPSPVRTGVSNIIANANAPVTFANDLLQGKPKKAQDTFMRFLINSTVGMGGFVDAAAAGGIEKHSEDFGQTLAVWGVGSGPYIVLPVFGPSSPRHIVGRAVDIAATPTTWLMADLSLLERSTPTMAGLISGREALLDDVKILRETSPDFYASVRDIYRQSRKSAIFDGEIEVDPIPDLPIE